MKQIDMTYGPIMKKVLLFAIPICAGNLLQQLYNTVDTLVIGNFCGSSSLAAVGTSAQPVEILLCIFLGLGTGVSILASQYVGRNDPETLIELTVRLPCGSPSISNTFFPACASPIPRLAQVVVLPTPPFWLATAMICVFNVFHLVSVCRVRFWK